MRNVSSELRESGPCHEPESVAMWGCMSDAYQSKINFSYDACKLLSAVRQKRLFTCSVCDKLSKAGLTMPGLFLVSFSIIPWFISGQYWFCCNSPCYRGCIFTGTALCNWYFIRKGDGLCKVQVIFSSSWQEQFMAEKLRIVANSDCFCFSFFQLSAGLSCGGKGKGDR